MELLKSFVESKEYRLLALTNWPAESWQWAQDTYPFMSWFEGIVVSGYEGVVKPDAQIYHILFDRYKVDPAKAVFMDDNKKNVEGAKAVGLHAIHVQSPDQLKSDLFNLLGKE